MVLELDEILGSLKSGKISLPKAKKLLSLYSLEKIENIAQIDVGRKNRRGIPEVIFAESKEFEDLKKIIQRLLKKSNSVLISRIKKKDYSKLKSFVKKMKLDYKTGKKTTTLLVYKNASKNYRGRIGIITAGTSDIGIAEEARLMCETMNCECICGYDVGVAGMHRVFPILKDLKSKEVDAIIVVAGMEGALPTLVSSLVDVPVIGVPTSVGYGYGEKGIAALASMLQSCSLGLSVVNIDNGIGAGAIAGKIANRTSKR